MYTSMFRKAMLGDTATLNLDFTTGTMPTAVTFTRADSTARATYIDASGYVKTVASAGDPRFDYTGGVAKGLLIEAAATNYLPYSDTLQGGSWFIGNNGAGGTVTVTNPYTASNPANGSTCTRLQFAIADGGGSPRLYYVTSQTSPYTMSVWMKSNTAGNHTISIFQNDAWVDFTITPTWQRFQTTRTAGGALVGFFMLANNSTTLTPDVLVYGAQLESGSGSASSYIRTTTASLTRLADDAVIRSTAWTSLYAQPGAMVVEFYRGAYGAGDRSIMSTDPTAARHWHLKNANASATAQIAFSTGSPVTQTGLTSGLNKVAIAWNAPTPTASFDLCVNGASPTFGGSNVGTTLSTWLTLGSQSTTGVSDSGTWDGYLNNSIKSVKYYTGLTYAEMQAKTT
jgi:hypothetical protein